MSSPVPKSEIYLGVGGILISAVVTGGVDDCFRFGRDVYTFPNRNKITARLVTIHIPKYISISHPKSNTIL